MQARAGQPGASAPCTVQGTLESCLSRIVGRRVPVHGAGRTDAGVHAEGQVCHMDLPEDAGRIDWKQALNMLLPYDIRIIRAEWVAADFHARSSACKKRYAYSLWMDRDKALPRIAPFVWSVPRLELAAMLPALPLLTGRRDFASFQNSGTLRASTIRSLHSIELRPGLLGPLACPEDWPVATLFFEGDGFLKQMVRNLSGLLVWIAQEKIKAEGIPAILAAKDRRALPSPSAPAQGLSLLEVMYERP